VSRFCKHFFYEATPIMLLIGKDRENVNISKKKHKTRLNLTTRQAALIVFQLKTMLDWRWKSFFSARRKKIIKKTLPPPTKKRATAHKAQSFVFLNEERRLINFFTLWWQSMQKSVSRREIKKKHPLSHRERESSLWRKTREERKAVVEFFAGCRRWAPEDFPAAAACLDKALLIGVALFAQNDHFTLCNDFASQPAAREREREKTHPLIFQPSGRQARM